MIGPCLNQLPASVRCKNRVVLIVDIAVLGDDEAVFGVIERIAFRSRHLQQIVALFGFQVPAEGVIAHDQDHAFLASVASVRSRNGIVIAILVFHGCTADNVAVGIILICFIELEHRSGKGVAVDQTVRFVEVYTIVRAVTGPLGLIFLLVGNCLFKSFQSDRVAVMNISFCVDFSSRCREICNRYAGFVGKIEGNHVALHVKVRRGNRISGRIRGLHGLVAFNLDGNILIANTEVCHFIGDNQNPIVGKL